MSSEAVNSSEPSAEKQRLRIGIAWPSSFWCSFSCCRHRGGRARGGGGEGGRGAGISGGEGEDQARPRQRDGTRCRTVPYRTVPYRTVPYRTAPYRTVPYRTAPHRTAPHRTARYRTVPYRTVQRSEQEWNVTTNRKTAHTVVRRQGRQVGAVYPPVLAPTYSAPRA